MKTCFRCKYIDTNKLRYVQGNRGIRFSIAILINQPSENHRGPCFYILSFSFIVLKFCTFRTRYDAIFISIKAPWAVGNRALTMITPPAFMSFKKTRETHKIKVYVERKNSILYSYPDFNHISMHEDMTKIFFK